MDCKYFKSNHCLSCSELGSDYVKTISGKERRLRDFFDAAHIPIPEIKPSIGLTSDAMGTRTKAKFAVYRSKGRITFGFTTSDAEYRELENCPLHEKNINPLLDVIRGALEKYQIEPYDIRKKTGELKYLIITKSNSGEELLIRFVARSKAALAAFKKIASHFPEHVVSLNIQPVHQAVLEGDEEICISDKLHIENRFGEFKLMLGSRSFFQVTPEIAERLYSAASELLQAVKPSSLLDLYCGVGAFSFYASRHCKSITGVEISKEAIECANLSKQVNKNDKIDFMALDVEKYLENPDLKFDAILVNPPRRGLNSSIIKKLMNISPGIIIYSSCNAESMVRDVELLKNKYSVESLQIFDMFPYTEHFETLMLLKIRS